MNVKSPINSHNMAASSKYDHSLLMPPKPSTSINVHLLTGSSKTDERIENRKNENAEKKKKDDKFKMKAEKDAKKVYDLTGLFIYKS